MAWFSQQLPAPPPPMESLEYRAYRQKLEYHYRASPIRRSGWALYASDIIRKSYTPPPILSRSGWAIYATQMKLSKVSAPPVLPTIGRILTLENLNG